MVRNIIQHFGLLFRTMQKLVAGQLNVFHLGFSNGSPTVIRSPSGYCGPDDSSSAPSAGSSTALTFEGCLMLEAWISAMVCLNGFPSTSSSTVRYLIFPSRLTRCSFWSVLAKLARLPQA